LEAAHIIPYCLTQDNRILNGLLLRADIHTLFDFNLVVIDPDTRRVYLDNRLQQSDSYRSFHRSASVSPSRSLSLIDYQLWIEAIKWRYENYQEYLR
jgi:predicted restriction endonuclease